MCVYRVYISIYTTSRRRRLRARRTIVRPKKYAVVSVGGHRRVSAVPTIHRPVVNTPKPTLSLTPIMAAAYRCRTYKKNLEI